MPRWARRGRAMSGFAELDEMTDAVRRLGTLPDDVARRSVTYVDAAVKATAAAGTDPNGKPWAPRKDGGRALVNAAAAISTKALGPVVQVTLTGPEVIHHFGDSRVPRRQIIPDGAAGIPKGVGDALDRAAADAFAAAMGRK